MKVKLLRKLRKRFKWLYREDGNISVYNIKQEEEYLFRDIPSALQGMFYKAGMKKLWNPYTYIDLRADKIRKNKLKTKYKIK